ncbi:MAG: FitA-like ribbon-helix-helix domain-containing protein [Synechococcaceae cyanobacterium]
MATLTLRNVPDDLVARLKARAKRHRRSLNNETIAALELADAAASGASNGRETPPVAAPVTIDSTLRRMEEIRAGLRAKAAAEGREALQPPPVPTRTSEEVAAQRARFAELRSRFKGPPLTREEIITAIERESHPPELDRFGNRINPEF